MAILDRADDRTEQSLHKEILLLGADFSNPLLFYSIENTRHAEPSLATLPPTGGWGRRGKWCTTPGIEQPASPCLCARLPSMERGPEAGIRVCLRSWLCENAALDVIRAI